MSFTRHLKQTATYWAPTGVDTFGGTTFAAPVQIKCRWEDKIEMFRDKRGEETMSKSKVFCNQALDLDGYLFLGASTAADPKTLAGAYEIRTVGSIPDLRNLTSITTAYL